MDSADDLTFRIIFSGDGAGRLRDKVKEKLKEFMGDYTDDTLVVCLVYEYSYGDITQKFVELIVNDQ